MWLININLFLTVVEVEKSKIKVPADSVSVESPLPNSYGHLLCLHKLEEARGVSAACFIKALISFIRALLFPKAPSPNTITLTVMAPITW